MCLWRFVCSVARSEELRRRQTTKQVSQYSISLTNKIWQKIHNFISITLICLCFYILLTGCFYSTDVDAQRHCQRRIANFASIRRAACVDAARSLARRSWTAVVAATDGRHALRNDSGQMIYKSSSVCCVFVFNFSLLLELVCSSSSVATHWWTGSNVYWFWIRALNECFFK